MSTSISNDLYVTWDDYHRLIEQLIAQVYEAGFKFDAILCLARGGLRIGDVVSRVYDMPLAILAASSYREAAGTQQGQLDIAQFITKTGGDIAGKVLLLDDLVDSGVTMARVIEHLKQRFPAVTEVRTAVLWYKAVSAFKPDYFVQYLDNSPWIHQPFEEYDALRPNQVAARLRSRSQQG
jgi:hypoxanthine phosphoribosyltransferase